MKRIHENLHIGTQEDYENNVKSQDGWFVIHACKEPYHRQELSYTGRSAPKDSPEYLIAKRNNRLILNLVDAPNSSYIPKEIIDTAIDTIVNNVDEKDVLVHCNQGMSRSAIIGLLYLHHINAISNDFETAEEEFRTLYPMYNPGKGMRQFAIDNWDKY